MANQNILETKSASEYVNAETKFVEINGRRIAYRTIGRGLPIIFANRFRGNLDTWDPAFLDALSLKFNVITIDYSGLGLSTGKRATDILSMAKDVRDVALALNLRSIIVGGWSIGGMVAQVVMTQYPELVSHAILIGTTPPGKNYGMPEKLFWETALKIDYDLDDEYVLFFEPHSESSKNAAKSSHNRIAKRTKDLDIPIPEDYWDDMKKAGDDFREDKYDTVGKLKTSKVPILVLCGDHDICFRVEDWYDVGKIPSAQLIVMPQAGHGPQHQYPELAAEYIAAFIQNSK